MKERVAAHDRRSYGGAAIRKHDEGEAERLIRWGLKVLGLREEDLPRQPKGSAQKRALAHLAHMRTMVSHQWLTERLHMGHPQNLSSYIKDAPTTAEESVNRLASTKMPGTLKYED